MSDTSQGPDWWQASDDLWYPPEDHPNHRPAPFPHPAQKKERAGLTTTGGPEQIEAGKNGTEVAPKGSALWKWALAIGVVVALASVGTVLAVASDACEPRRSSSVGSSNRRPDR